MSENRSLNSLFARLDESKANRANEANREHEKAAEEAEKERQKKKGEYFYSKRLIHGINPLLRSTACTMTITSRKL